MVPMVSITLCSLKEPETLIDEWMTLLPPQPELSTTLKCFFILFIFNLWSYTKYTVTNIYCYSVSGGPLCALYDVTQSKYP